MTAGSSCKRVRDPAGAFVGVGAGVWAPALASASFASPNPAIKIEFQGGEPLVNFELIAHVVPAPALSRARTVRPGRARRRVLRGAVVGTSRYFEEAQQAAGWLIAAAVGCAIPAFGAIALADATRAQVPLLTNDVSSRRSCSDPRQRIPWACPRSRSNCGVTGNVAALGYTRG